MPRLGWWLLLVFLLAMPCLLGTVGSYVVLALALLCGVALWRPGASSLLRGQPAVLLFAGAFALLLGAFATTARTPEDLKYALNFLPFLLAAPVYLVARDHAGRDAIRWFAVLCLLGAALALAVAVIEVRYTGHRRAVGSFSNSNVFGRMALLLGFLSLSGLFVTRHLLRWLFYLGPVFGVVATVLAGARGAFIALPFMLVIFAVAFFFQPQARRHLVAFLVVGAICVVVTVTAAHLANLARFTEMFDLIVQALTSGTSDDKSTTIRLAFYSAGLAAFIEAPWLGHGWASLANAAFAQIPAAEYDAALVRFFHFHSDVVDFGVAAGLVGILAYAMMIFAPVVGAISSQRGELFLVRIYAATLLTVTYLIFGLTDMTIGYDLPTTSFAILSAVILGSFHTPSDRDADRAAHP